jgi:NAD(P)-dependent dehydrogenase (short-subunit alcohol dehydrogenase family)
MSALVTGGGAIGTAVGERLAASGHAVAADLRDPVGIAAAFAACEGALGPVDVLVDSAAVLPSGPFVDVTVEQLDETYEVDVRGHVRCAQAATRTPRSSPARRSTWTAAG